MTGKQLFSHRFKLHIKFFVRLQRLAIDWTVHLYIFVPLLVVFFLHYASWWKMEATWLNGVNELYLSIVLAFITLLGYQFSFLYQADLLYLWQKKNLIGSLIKYKLRFYFIINLIKSFLLILVIFPILYLYLSWSYLQIFIFWAVLFVVLAIMQELKRYVKVRYSKSVQVASITGLYILSSLVLFLSSNLYGALSMLVLLAIIYKYLLKRLSMSTPKFYKEIELDSNYRSKLTQFILMQSTHLGAPDFLSESISQTRKTPKLFSNSKKIFKPYTPEAGYQEVFIKTLLRNKNWVLLYTQIIGVGLFGIIMFPHIFKVLIWIGMLVLTGNLLINYWWKVIGHRFMSLVKWKDVNLKKVAKNTFMIGMFPCWFILSIVIGYMLIGIWGILFVPLIGFLISQTIIYIIVTKMISD